MTPIVEKIRTRGHWWIVIRPTQFEEKRIAYSQLGPLLRSLRVGFGGWDFPHIDESRELERGPDFVGQGIDFQHFKEYSRFYQSCQFAWLGGIMDDWRDESAWWPQDAAAGRKTIGIGETLRKLSQVFELAARLAVGPTGGAAIRVEVTLEGLRDRELIGDNPRRFWHVAVPFKTQAAKIEFAEDLDAGTLVGKTRELARQWALDVFDRFGWTPPVDRIVAWQDEVLRE